MWLWSPVRARDSPPSALTQKDTSVRCCAIYSEKLSAAPPRNKRITRRLLPRRQHLGLWLFTLALLKQDLSVWGSLAPTVTGRGSSWSTHPKISCHSLLDVRLDTGSFWSSVLSFLFWTSHDPLGLSCFYGVSSQWSQIPRLSSLPQSAGSLASGSFPTWSWATSFCFRDVNGLRIVSQPGTLRLSHETPQMAFLLSRFLHPSLGPKTEASDLTKNTVFISF